MAVVMLSTVSLTTKSEAELEAEFDRKLDELDNGNEEASDEEYEAWGDELDRARKARFDAWCKPFTRRLETSPLNGLGPANPDEARRWLSNLVSAQIRRLHQVRAQNQELADADLADAPARLPMETGAEGDLQRRYVLSRDRAFNRSVDTFLKVRKMSESGQMVPADIENPVLPDVPKNGPVPVEPDQPGKRSQIVLVPSVGMLDWCDGGVPISDEAEAGAIEPDADPAPPRAKMRPRNPMARSPLGTKRLFFETNPPRNARKSQTSGRRGFFRNEPTADREEEPESGTRRHFFRNEPTAKREDERAEVVEAPGQILPALPEPAMKRDAEREAGLGSRQSPQPEKRTLAFDPLVPVGGPLDEASLPAVRRVPAPWVMGALINPGARSIRPP